MDREKVIAWLADTELYYRETGKTENELYQSEMAHNAIALLKEQDALCFALEQANNTNKYLNDVLTKKGVEPKKFIGLIDCSSPWLQYSCGSCKEPLLIRYKFCPNCGKPIRW